MRETKRATNLRSVLNLLTRVHNNPNIAASAAVLSHYPEVKPLVKQVGRNQLMFVALKGDYDKFNRLLERDQFDQGISDSLGNTALHYAASREDHDPRFVAALLDRGVDSNPQNNEGDTPLMLAVKHEATESIRTLLAPRPEGIPNTDLSLVNNKNQTAGDLLLQSKILDKFEVEFGLNRHPAMQLRKALNLLTRVHSNPNVAASAAVLSHRYPGIKHLVKQVGRNQLMFVALKGDYDKFDRLLERDQFDQGISDSLGNTALHYAASREDHDPRFVAALLDRGVDSNPQNKEGDSPLMFAVKHEATESVRTLLAPRPEGIPNTDLNLVNNKNQTAGDFAVNHSKTASSIIPLLISAGFNLTDHPSTSFRMLELALRMNNNRLLDFLINKGANINQPDAPGHPRMYSLYYNLLGPHAPYNQEALLLLVAANTTINRPMTLNSEQTPLTCAIVRGEPTAVSILLEGGADPNYHSPGGKIPLNLIMDTITEEITKAHTKGTHGIISPPSRKIVELLIMYGVNPSTLTNSFHIDMFNQILAKMKNGALPKKKKKKSLIPESNSDIPESNSD